MFGQLAMLKPVTSRLWGYLKNIHVIAGFTDALELELEFMKKQIRTLKVCLGVVQTPLSRDFRDKVCPR